jgi:hypothetical protein
VSKFDKEIAAVAATQHQVITFADVEKAEGNRSHVRTRLASGRWELFSDNVYRLAGVPWTWEAKAFAHVCAAGDGAVASHFCAMRLHGMGFKTAGPELSVPRKRFHRPKGVTVHTSRDLDRCGIVTLAGCIPTTDPARTILDIAGKLKLQATLRNAINRGRRDGHFEWNDLIATLATHARQGRRGIAALREAIAAGYTENEATDTDSELMAFGLFKQYGYPEPVVHHVVRAPDGEKEGEIDLSYPERRIGWEIDGSVHLDPVQKAKDDARDDRLRTIYGWRIRRIWWEIPMYEPRKFIQILKATLA